MGTQQPGKRVLLSGKAPAFQAGITGSIPVTRSNLLQLVFNVKHDSTHWYPDLKFAWPTIPFHVVLVEPEIPPNTGNVARLCAATGTVLHLVGPLGFQITDRRLKRAGLDYWDSVELVHHAGIGALNASPPSGRRFYFSTRGAKCYTEAGYEPGDVLIFGPESRGLDEAILAGNADRVYAIPLRSEHVRSLNLATAVGIVLYEALRQVALLRMS